MEVIRPVEPKLVPRVASHFDSRGIFSRLVDSPNDFPFQQINTSINLHKGVFRGLHLLRGKHSETKKITVLMGEIIDFALNVDYNSTDYGKIYEFELSQESESLLIPPLHAHGFLTLSEITVLAYQVDKPYVPHADAGINIKGLELKRNVTSSIKTISSKDVALPQFRPSVDMEFSTCKFC